MKTHNYLYQDLQKLENFIQEKNYKDEKNLLVQIFTGVCDEVFINELVHNIVSLIPQVNIIGSSTDGEIMDGEIFDHSTILSFSVFENTVIKTEAVELQEDSYQTAISLLEKIQERKKAKLLISFVSGLEVNGEDYLKAFEDEAKELVIAGGLAGDNATFTGTIIFTQKGVAKTGAVGAVLYNEALHVHTHYNFSWENIGKILKVTKAQKNRVYTIDGIKATEIYKKYLGDEIEQMLPATGIEFPLIIKKGELNIARAVLNKHDDGSLSFAGNIEEGASVQFGYGNIESILQEAPKCTKELLPHPIESIFVYSCMARKHLLGKGIVAELDLLNKIAPMSGFFTYGEFFHDTNSTNELLNQTMTLLTISEGDDLYHGDVLQEQYTKSNDAHTVSALSHLISVTSKELHELNNDLEGKIAEKTSQLQTLNSGLEKRVEEETQKVAEQYETLVEAQKKLIENEKFASLGTLVAGVAHEINTPVGLSLTGISHIEHELKKLHQAYEFGEMTESDFTTYLEETRLMSKSIHTNLIKAAHLVKSFKQVSVDQSSEEDRLFNVSEYIDEILISLHNKIKLTKHTVKVDIAKEIYITSNPGSLSQIITNLIMNSLLHAFDDEKSGEIGISVHTENQDMILVYKDDGKGMNDEVQAKIFDPFFTTKRGHGGSGLGMNIIYNIITRKLKGSISLKSKLGEGCEFVLRFPNVIKQ